MRWLTSWLTRRRRYADLAESIREHLEEKAAELEVGGMARAEAERLARRAFGPAEQIEQRGREVWRWSRLENGAADLRRSLRQLAQSPGFAAVVVLTMALGIGSATAIFSLVDTALLRSLPFPRADRIVHIQDVRLRGAGAVGLVAVPRFFDLRAEAESLQAVTFYMSDHKTLAVGTQPPVAVKAASASGQFWRVFGVKPLLGRTFTEQDDQPAAPGVAVLGYATWQSLFRGDPRVIGRSIKLDQQPATVIGVMPENFRPPFGAALLRPAQWSPADWSSYRGDGTRFLNVFARLKSGVSLAMAQQDLNRVEAQLGREYPATDSQWRFATETLRDDLYGNLRPALLMLLGASGLLLLIACVNVGTLTLSRAAAREGEMALRQALGASQGRIVLQFLSESLMLSLLGGGLGLAASFAFIRGAAAALPGHLGTPGAVAMGWPMAGFALTLALLIGVAFGMVLAWRGRRVEPNRALQRAGTRLAAGGRQRTRTSLLAVQMGLSLVLLVGAALLGESLWNLWRKPLGFAPDHLLTFSINLPWDMKPAQVHNFYHDLQRRIASLPGVEAAGQITALPTVDWHNRGSFDADWLPRTPRHDAVNVEIRSIAGDYLEAMGTPLLAGRRLMPRDLLLKQTPVLVNQAFARKYLPDGNPVGRHLIGDPSGNNAEPMEIVGIIGDMRGTGGSIAQAVGPEVYFPALDEVVTRYFAVRSSLPPEQLLPMIQQQVRLTDPAQAVGEVRSMDDLIGQAVALPRLNLALVAFFALMALLLTCVGVYGVVAYAVARRTREIGVRMALGASRGQILFAFARGVLVAALAGIAGGGATAWLSARLLRSELYGVAPDSPLLYLAALLALMLPVLLATLWPAWRAATMAPLQALRTE